MKKLSEYECKVGVEVKGVYFDRALAALEELRACEVPLFRTHLEDGPEYGPLFPIYGPSGEGPERAVFYLLCDGADQEASTLRKELSDRRAWLEEIANACLGAGIDGNLGIVEGIKVARSRLACNSNVEGCRVFCGCCHEEILAAAKLPAPALPEAVAEAAEVVRHRIREWDAGGWSAQKLADASRALLDAIDAARSPR